MAVLSTLHPVGPQQTVNIIEFYYPEDIVAFERELVEAHRAAYMETAIEDDEIAERMGRGPQSAARPRRERNRPLPIAAGRRHDAFS